jgi:hypothetical protein
LAALAGGLPGPWSVASIGGQIYWSDLVSGQVSLLPSPTAPIRSVAAGLLTPSVVTGGPKPYFLSGDGKVLGLDANLIPTLRASSFAGAFSLAANEPALYWTNGPRDMVIAQPSPSEIPATVWRRPGTGTPRMIRQLAGAIRFAVAGLSGPGGIFTVDSTAAPTIPTGSPICAPGGVGNTCALVAATLVPQVECVVETADHRLIAHFGYVNNDVAFRRVGVGVDNHVDRGDGDGCQTTTFAPGAHHDVFAVGFTDEISWILGQRSATASRSSVRCQTGVVRNVDVSP